MTNKKDAICHQDVWYKEKLYLVLLGLALINIVHFILDYFGITILHDLIFAFYDYLRMIWLPIVIGFLLGGLIDYLIPRAYVTKYLAQHKTSTIFFSVGLGFLMSACSHGILAISMELYKKGASTPAVITFLLASPWANLPITIILLGFFGTRALLFIISAIAIAITTGLIYQVLDRKKLIECKNHHHNQEQFSMWADITTRINNYQFNFRSLNRGLINVTKGAWSLAKMVLWWILIGMFLASLARAFIPQQFFMNYMSATGLGLIVTLALATVIEICSEGSSPLAFEIFKQTGAFGNAFVFLMAGVITDYTEIGLIWSNIGKKAALWLPIITVPQVVILGWLFNLL